MSYQQSPSEGPYQQQQPPVMSPQGGGSIDFQGILKSQQARPYVIAGAGALIALIGYLALPFWGYSFKASASAFTQAVSTSGSYGGSDMHLLGGIYGLSWLVLIASIVGVVVAGLMLFAPKMVAQLTPRLAAMTLTICGAVSTVLLVLDWLKLNSYKGLFSSVGSGFSAGVSWGMYVTILASIALLVGGVMQLQRSPKVV